LNGETRPGGESGSEHPGQRTEAPRYEPCELLAVENLARTEALRLLGLARRGGPRAQTVLAGRGSSGAAAFALARHLANYGLDARVAFCGPEHRLSPLAALERGILEGLGVRSEEFAPGEARALVRELGGDQVLVDGAGEVGAPGREEEFARAAAEGSPLPEGAGGGGRAVLLRPSADWKVPAPRPEDAVFSPGSAPRSREEVRLADSVTMERYGIPGLALMENAGWRAAREAYAMLSFAPGLEVVVVAGAGNNGGDGLVAARHLLSWGVDCRVVLVAARGKVMDDALTNLQLAEWAGVELEFAPDPSAVEALLPPALERAGLVLDAVLGTGLTGRVRGPPGRAVEMLEGLGPRLLAVDTPSGLDANTGEVLGASTRAERTVTFAFPKLGFDLGEGPARAGEVAVADISMPRALWERK
jgi:hydroxyethylthiazole kinase-like uncharacterized protein yjeF